MRDLEISLFYIVFYMHSYGRILPFIDKNCFASASHRHENGEKQSSSPLFYFLMKFVSSKTVQLANAILL